MPNPPPVPTRPPMPLRAYLEALGPLVREVRGRTDLTVTGAAHDSRHVQPGGLFVAVPGSRDDGTRYAADAVRRGAVAVVSPALVPDLPPELTQIVVREAYEAAARVAEALYGFPARDLRLLGVTGTNGKTTSAYLMRDLWAAAGERVGLVSTVQYEVPGEVIPADRTTPPADELQSLLCRMRDGGVGTVVMEVSSHALDQHRPGTARLAGAVFTNLTGDHLDYHRTMDAYYAAKKRLFDEYLAPGAPAVVNADCEYGRRLLADLAPLGAALVGFGRCAEATVRVGDERNTADGNRFTLNLPSAPPLVLESPLMGAYNVSNAAGVAVLALALGLDRELVRRVIAGFEGAPGRLQPVRARNGVLAFVDYAHTDDALRNVLGAVRGLKPHRVLVVFGCGGDRDRTKRPRMGRVAAELADRLYLTSDNPRSEDPEAILAEIRTGIPAATWCVSLVDRRQAIRTAVADAQPGDLIVVAGKGHEPYQDQAGVKTPFDDVDETRAAMQACGIL